tara:strand:+ start:79 stop:405 length:327 start_codon:yes stop_codon:yes gene_type:complete
MSLSELITSNLNFAIEQIATSLTAVSPTNSEVYKASKQNVSGGFSIFDDGREETVETNFYINKAQHSILPSKGMILTDGVKNYKVVSTFTDSVNVTLKIECSAQYASN